MAEMKTGRDCGMKRGLAVHPKRKMSLISEQYNNKCPNTSADANLKNSSFGRRFPIQIQTAVYGNEKTRTERQELNSALESNFRPFAVTEIPKKWQQTGQSHSEIFRQRGAKVIDWTYNKWISLGDSFSTKKMSIETLMEELQAVALDLEKYEFEKWQNKNSTCFSQYRPERFVLEKKRQECSI